MTSDEITITTPAQISKFRAEDDGAITVDWIVLTAAIVGLAATGGTVIHAAITTLSASVSSGVSTKTVSNGD